MSMLKRLSEITYKEFCGICRETRYHNQDKINKCMNCPAYVKPTDNATSGACYFACKQVVDNCGDKFVDDGSIPDEDLPYWYN